MSTNCEEERLFRAAMNGDLDEVKRLVIDCGLDPNARNRIGSTPLHDAAWSGHPEVVRFLLERGVDPNVRNNDGWTPLHSAAKNCHVDVARVLLDHGADPTIRDNEGRTPLDIGSECPQEFGEMLRRRGDRTMVYE
jgi:ankyrin repeat protein